MVKPDGLESWESEILHAALAPAKPFEISLKRRVDLAFAAGVATGKKNAIKKIAAFTVLSLSLGLVVGLVFGFEMRSSPVLPKIANLVPLDHLSEEKGIWTISSEPDWLAGPIEKGSFQELAGGREWTIGFAIKNWDEFMEKGQ
jgi:hypothetical protein